jgi:hypothetical protein
MILISKLRNFIDYHRDKRRVQQTYRERFGRSINWRHPTRFTEKIQIFKISKTAEDSWKYVDKLEVRSYIEQQIGAEYLTKLLGVYNNADEINFEALPNAFVLKTTHGSGWNIICPDKSTLNIPEAKAKLTDWLSQNYYRSYGRERQYKRTVPKIICEEYLDTPEKGLYDFKFYCFHGEPRIINVIQDRIGVTRKAFYELPWRKSELQPWEAQADLDMPRPKDLDKMMDISRKLSKPFEQIRVDLYNINGRILFGELTLTCSSGMKYYNPDRYDELLGSYW